MATGPDLYCAKLNPYGKPELEEKPGIRINLLSVRTLCITLHSPFIYIKKKIIDFIKNSFIYIEDGLK